MSALQQLHHPSSVEQALHLLGRGEGVRCLAGGATLVAMMNAGLVEPLELVSLSAIAELRGIAAQPDGLLRIGAMVRHREIASEARLAGTLAVVRDAAGKIANPPIRNMGTIGGSIAAADPAADYPPALVAADAQIEIAAAAGRRCVPAREFFVDWYATVLAPGEMVTAVLLPASAGGVGLYEKLARVAGDHAIASVALSVAMRGGAYAAVRAAIGGCGPKPVFLPEANELLRSAALSEDAARRAGDMLAAAADPVDDVRGSAEYRRLVIPRMLVQAAGSARAQIAGQA